MQKSFALFYKEKRAYLLFEFMILVAFAGFAQVGILNFLALGACFVLIALVQFIEFRNAPLPVQKPVEIVEVRMKKEENETDLEMLGKLFIADSAINGLPVRKFIGDNCYEFATVLGITQTEVKKLYARAHTLLAEVQESYFKTEYAKAGFKKDSHE